MSKPTAGDVRKFAEIHEIGMLEAKKILEREHLLMDIDALGCSNDLKGILRRLVK